MDRYKIALIKQDRELQGLSLRSLAKKYRMPLSTIFTIVGKTSKTGKRSAMRREPEAGTDELSVLKAQLHQEQLKNELLNNMIDIASKELGVDIRKKSGTGQSE